MLNGRISSLGIQSERGEERSRYGTVLLSDSDLAQIPRDRTCVLMDGLEVVVTLHVLLDEITQRLELLSKVLIRYRSWEEMAQLELVSNRGAWGAGDRGLGLEGVVLDGRVFGTRGSALASPQEEEGSGSNSNSDDKAGDGNACYRATRKFIAGTLGHIKSPGGTRGRT